MKYFIVFIIALSLFSSLVFSQTAEELYDKAASYYNAGEYFKALDELQKINSKDINIEPLKKEVEKKISLKNKIDNEFFNTAVTFYNDGKYIESLNILVDLSNPNINSQALIEEINQKLLEKTQKETLQIDDVAKKTQESKVVKSSEPIKSTRSLEDDEDLIVKEEGNESVNESSTVPVKQNETIIAEEFDVGLNSRHYIYVFLIVLIVALLIVDFVIIKNLSKKDKRNFYLLDSSNNKKYIFNKERIKIGRAPGNDFVINRDGLSAYHAKIEFNKKVNSFLIKDLKSTNGTYLNNKKVMLARLENDDLVKFSNIGFRFKF